MNLYNYYLCTNTNLLHQNYKMQQERQSNQRYAKVAYQQYLIEFRLEQKIFEVKIMNEVTLEIYSQKITEEYIINRQDFKNIFEAPEDLFCYLISNQQTIVFDKKGQLRFQVKLAGKNNKSKVLTIPITKLEQNQAQLIQLRYQKLQAKFKDYIRQKEKESATLTQNVKKLQELIPSLSLRYQKMIRLRLNIHQNALDKDYFVLSYEDNSLHVSLKTQMINEDQSYEQIESEEDQILGFCFINCYSITPMTKQIYHTKIISGDDNDYAIGFVTTDISFNQGQLRGQDKIFLHGSSIYNQNDIQKLDVKFTKDDIISSVIELIGQRAIIEWLKNGVKFGQTEISKYMKDKGLYYCIILYEQTNKVSIRVQDIEI